MARRGRRVAHSPELPSPDAAPLAALPTNRKRERAEISTTDLDSPTTAAAESSSPNKSKSARKQDAKKRKGEKLAATENEQLQQALASSLEDAAAVKPRVDKGKSKASDQDLAQPDPPADPALVALRKEVTFKDTVSPSRITRCRLMNSDTFRQLIQNQTTLLESLRSTIACTICLETLELPYSLACGHILSVLSISTGKDTAEILRNRSCRKCLLVWFHRVDVNADPPAADDDDDIESVNSEIILPPVAPATNESSSDDSSSEDGAAPSQHQVMLNTLVRPRKKTLQELADETTGSDSSDDKPAPRARPREIYGTLGGRAFTVRGGNQRAIFNAMERAMHRMADGLSSGAGDKDIAKAGREYQASITGEDTGPPTRDEMRAARLARFGAEGGDVSTAVNAAAGPSGARSSPRLATAHQPSPPRVSRRIVVDSEEEDVPPPRRAPPPPPPAVPNPIPTGEHRIKNLVCPHCRDAVDRAPIRIFVLSEIVSLVRAAEATGLVGLGTSGTPATSTSAPLPGMVETDLSWGGLFDVVGVETKAQKKARRAVVMDDTEDRVRRCGHCNWEIDETNGICDGWSVVPPFVLYSPLTLRIRSGQEWDLSDGEGSADSFRGDAFPLGAGYNSNEDRSSEQDDSESDDGFVVKSSPPAAGRSRQPIILSDSENESSASEGEVEVIGKARMKKPRIVDSEEDEPVAVKRISRSNKIVEIDSDEEEVAPVVKRKSRKTVAVDSDEEDKPVVKSRSKSKSSKIVEIDSDEEEVSPIVKRKLRKTVAVDSDSDEEDEPVVKSKSKSRKIVEIVSDEEENGTGSEDPDEEDDDSAGGWDLDPDNYTRALSNTPSVDSEAAYREECW